MTLVLELGKRYRMRNGFLTSILEMAISPESYEFTFAADTYEDTKYPDRATHRRTWTKEGKWKSPSFDTPFDLVEEYVEEEAEQITATFNTQQEIWAYLSSGGFVRNVEEPTIIIGFEENGRLKTYSDSFEDNIAWSLTNPTSWVKTDKPVTNWYDNIPEQGILCWCQNSEDDDTLVLVAITEYNPKETYKFVSNHGNWIYATPTTLDEVAKYIYECE